MALFEKSDIDLTILGNMETDNFEKELTKLRGLLEEYANGGFDLIRSKKEDNLAFFSVNDNCFMDLLIA
jgi:hypothetical protein